MLFSNKSLEVLITYVVAYRLFGWDRPGAQEAMKELMQRKIKQPEIDFENAIEQAILQAPKTKVNLKQPLSLSDLLSK